MKRAFTSLLLVCLLSVAWGTSDSKKSEGATSYGTGAPQDVIVHNSFRGGKFLAAADTLLVIFHDTTLGTAGEIQKRKADRDTLFRYLGTYAPVYRVVYIDTNNTLSNLAGYKQILYVETSFDATVCRYLGIAARQAVKDWLNSGTPLNKKSFIIVGADIGYNYSRPTSTARDTNMSQQMLKFTYRLDNANVSTQNSMTGQTVNTGMVFPYNTSPPGAGFWPDGCLPGPASNVLYTHTGRTANDSVAGVGYTAPGYTSASLFVDPRYLPVSGANTGFGPVLRSLLQYAGVVTDVKLSSTGLPQEYMLMQNYPNPFNPTTTIRYELPRASHVSVKIYNSLGQEVARLKNEVENVGTYDVVWRGRNSLGQTVASGVYFYQLEARPVDGSSPFNSFKKMLLLK